MTTKSAVFAGSFDPLTLGHLDIISRAAAIFEKLYVVVGTSSEKKSFLPLETRVKFLTEATVSLGNVEVETHGGLTVDFAQVKGAGVLVRGIRSGDDVSYESAMAQMNRTLATEIETVWFFTKPEYFHISSSLVKDVAKHGGDLSKLVPPSVLVHLSEKH